MLLGDLTVGSVRRHKLNWEWEKFLHPTALPSTVPGQRFRFFEPASHLNNILFAGAWWWCFHPAGSFMGWTYHSWVFQYSSACDLQPSQFSTGSNWLPSWQIYPRIYHAGHREPKALQLMHHIFPSPQAATYNFHIINHSCSCFTQSMGCPQIIKGWSPCWMLRYLTKTYVGSGGVSSAPCLQMLHLSEPRPVPLLPWACHTISSPSCSTLHPWTCSSFLLFLSQ